MKRKVARLKLSPNEEARIIREEYERRRKLRIQQVREQQRCIALNIRRAVEQRRQHELEQLGKELREEWEREQSEKINTLQKRYQESLQLLGQGHRSAKENEPDWAAIAQREEENHAKAEERFREALKELKSQRLQDCERQNRFINARKKALEAEKERSARVASLPLPPPNPIQNIDFKTQRRIRKSDASAFASTYYHMADRMVEREDEQKQPKAHEEAEVQVKRQQEMEVVQMRRREEQLEKAHLRGKQALRREHLEQDHERLLVELEHMQQRDLLRRRQQVAKMPPQMFQPLYKRTELEEDFQRQMEFAFEDVYPGERRLDVDLVGPEPLLELSAGIQDLELDVTQDEGTAPSSEDVEQDTGRREQELSAAVEQVKAPPKHPLKKLLDQIRSQRNQWLEHETPAELPTVITEEIPEKDTTIDTGSLTSAEKSSMPPVQRHKTGPRASGTSERSADAAPQPPDEPVERHEQRAKWNEELENQKLEQLALLKDLEEQKAKLEQMLLESQQEKNQLEMVVTHEEPQPESIISDRGGGSAETTQLTPPPDEDDHSRQLREHQHQLLERSRMHQASVEAARQRLERYQRALQTRYSIDANEPLESVSDAGPPASDACPSLADVLLERTKRHLQDRARPGQVAALPQDPVHPLSLGATKDRISGGREQQQSQTRAWEVEPRRQHLPSGAQPEPIPGGACEERASGNMAQTRRSLLQSLLKAIEQRNGGTLSHLEDVRSANGPAPGQSGELPHGSTLEPLDQREPEELHPGDWGAAGRHAATHVPHLFASLLEDAGIKRDSSGTEDAPEPVCQDVSTGPAPSPVHPAGPVRPSEATRPPVTRVKPGVWEMWPQHELSAIPEVETTFRRSLDTGWGSSLRLSSHGADPLEQSPPPTAGGQNILDESRNSESSSGSSSHRMWTERVLRWSRSPQCSLSDSNITLSEPGSGADYRGPTLTASRSPPEAAACPERHGLSTTSLSTTSLSTTSLSTSSYVTTDPEHTSGRVWAGTGATGPAPGPDCAPSSSERSPPLVGVGAGADLLAVLAPPGGRRCAPDEASPRLAVKELFSSSRIQGIIDKYTKELDFSLCSPGSSTAESDGLAVRAPGASAAPPLGLLDPEEDERTLGSVASDAAAAPGNSLQRESPAGPVQERDALGPPTVPPADRRELEHVLGHPSAHSSLIGPLPGLPFSLDQSGWDSTLTRMFGQFGSERQAGGQEPGGLQPLGPMSAELLTTWFDGSPEESQMEPLVEELDESAGQQTQGERSRVDLGALDEVTGPSHQESPPPASGPRAQTGPADLDQGSSQDWDSFHLLTAELTHNDPADASTSVWADQNQPPPWEPAAPFSPTTNRSLEPEQSRELFRAKDPDAGAGAVTPLGSLLLGSPEHVSALESPHVGVLEPGDPAGGSVGPPEDRSCLWDSEESPGLLRAQDVDQDRGILEQSQITLVSLTDTSLQDPEDDAAPWGDGPQTETEPGSAAEPRGRSRTGPGTGPQGNLLASGPGGGPQPLYQHKRKVLLQKLTRRAQTLRTKGAQSKSGSDGGEQLASGAQVDPSPGERSQPAGCSGSAPQAPPRSPRSKAAQELAKIPGDQRKLAVAEMRQRTRRLYEQLEEVKQQRAVRSRQQASSHNRLKAKEFHQRTLQRLRAKQTPR